MRTAASLVVLTVMLSACASRNRPPEGSDLAHDHETCTIDGHNHTAEAMAGARAEAEDGARDAAWHARERERSKQGGTAKPRTPQPDSAKARVPPGS